MTLLSTWPPHHGDPGLILFTACLQAWGFDLPPNATVLELGCHESPFASVLKAARPDVTIIGIDARERAMDGPSFAGDRLIMGDASDRRLWAREFYQDGPPQRFDAIVALSSVEHFGLGWYGDPVVLEADMQALEHAQYWLAPGGWLYYDVPWHPDTYAETAHYRRYTDATLPHVRAGGYVEHARTWVIPEREMVLLQRPDVHGPDNKHPFFYVAVWASRGDL